MKLQINKSCCEHSPIFVRSYVDVPIDSNMMSGWLFSRVLASHAGGPGLIPGRDMSVLGTLV
jgi:hypothetical protein